MKLTCMKKIYILIFITLIGGILSFSCTDKCKDITCNNGGTCNDGKCSCAPGFEGNNCSTASRDKFIGTWIGTTSSLMEGSDSTTVTPDTLVFTAKKDSPNEMRFNKVTGDFIPQGNTLRLKMVENTPFYSYEITEAAFIVSGNTMTLPLSSAKITIFGTTTNAKFQGKWTKI